MPHATISDNTSSLDGEPYGGQLGSLLGSGEVEIINSLVSGSAAQGPSGDFVFIDADAAQLERVSIVNTASSFPYSGLDGFLSSDLADPSVFGELSSAYPGIIRERSTDPSRRNVLNTCLSCRVAPPSTRKPREEPAQLQLFWAMTRFVPPETIVPT